MKDRIKNEEFDLDFEIFSLRAKMDLNKKAAEMFGAEYKHLDARNYSKGGKNMSPEQLARYANDVLKQAKDNAKAYFEIGIDLMSIVNGIEDRYEDILFRLPDPPKEINI